MKIKISNSELRSMGCSSCLWKAHKQCPYGLSGTDTFKPKETKGSKGVEGMCQQYLEFILSFADIDDSINSLWEKFSLYVARLQSMNDYQEYIKLKDEIEEKKDNMDYREQAQYEMQLNTLRLFWERLSSEVRKGYGRITDREQKAKEVTKLPGIMNARTINFNLENKETKQVEHIKKET